MAKYSVQYKISPKIVVIAEGETQVEVFDGLAKFEELLAQQVCGCCGSTDYKFQVRVVDDNKYHELVCRNQDCRAKLCFGQNKKGGGLFPKRKDADKNWLPDGGWSTTFAGKGSSNEEDEGEEVAAPKPARRGK